MTRVNERVLLCLSLTAAEPWPENATLYQPLKGEGLKRPELSVCMFASFTFVPVFSSQRIRFCCQTPPPLWQFRLTSGCVGFQCRWSAGQTPNTCRLLGHSLSDGLDDVQRAEMKAYMELVNNMLLTAELFIQWCDEATVSQITRHRYGTPYSWPLNLILAYQKQWEVRRKMNAVGWGGKTVDQVYEDVSQCCQALSQRLGTQPYFFKIPTELDALVFGHLFTILTTQLTNTELLERVRSYSNLLSFCRRIEQTYFESKDS
uniref:Metaxin-2 n=1 Tax=Oryzias sinensis TaxID=183150 RepID=A0A8C7YCC7_9TELE